MEIQDFLGITIVGIAASFIIEVITTKFATTPLTSKAISIGFCIVVGTAYFVLRQTVWWSTIIGVLTAASTVYALFFNSNGTQNS